MCKIELSFWRESFLHNISPPLLLWEAGACLYCLVPITTYHSLSNKWQIKPSAGQMNEGRGFIPENTCSGSIPLFLLRPKLAHVRDTRSSRGVRKATGSEHRFPAPRAGAQAACCSQGRCQSSWEEGDGTIKPSPLDFPSLPCSFLCCRPWSD